MERHAPDDAPRSPLATVTSLAPWTARNREPVEEGAGRMTGQVRAGEEPWWADARCNDRSGRLTAIFFSGDPQDIARAKGICATCPALLPCLEGAIERREPWGVWGGEFFLDGRILAIKRRRGRPRKLPRPEDIVPHVHLPEHLRGAPVAGDA
jgi:WhiB family redox-sensing transcriptional regulator